MATCASQGCPRLLLRKKCYKHGHCCQACRYGEPSHTNNCLRPDRDDTHNTNRHWRNARTIVGHTSVLAGLSQADQFADATARHSSSFPLTMMVASSSIMPLTLPASWCLGDLAGRSGDPVMEYVEWYARRYDLSLRGLGEWQLLSAHLLNRVEEVESARPLRLFAHRQDSIPLSRREYELACVDVADKGVDGLSPMYKIGDVTGVDFRVQAVVAMHAATAASLLFEAIQIIENRDVRERAFLCHGATHRSVACCFLPAAIVYPRAETYLTTAARTRRDAHSFGLYARPIDFASSCFSWQGGASGCSRQRRRARRRRRWRVDERPWRLRLRRRLLGGAVAGFTELTAGEVAALN